MNNDGTRSLLRALEALGDQPMKLMEVCGTHTMAIARSGLKTVLPKNIQLLSGPGCPVCVTPAEVIDGVLELAMEKNVILASYGDMLRVPGSVPGDSLLRRRAIGARVEIVYSPIDAVTLARENTGREVVFLGVGFETTAPGTAAAVLTAREEGVRNFSVLSMLKTVEPALRALIATEDFQVDGFLCPGHVGSIIGEAGFRFLPEEYNLPGVIAGFEPEEILLAVYHLAKQVTDGCSRLENDYRRAVRPEGNLLAQTMMEQCLEPRRDLWRGLGMIENSGLGLKDELAAFDAGKKFSLPVVPTARPTACRCGDVICGRLRPEECLLFSRRCTPEEPVGPCMVSTEGACAAAYQYRGI